MATNLRRNMLGFDGGDSPIIDSLHSLFEQF